MQLLSLLRKHAVLVAIACVVIVVCVVIYAVRLFQYRRLFRRIDSPRSLLLFERGLPVPVARNTYVSAEKFLPPRSPRNFTVSMWLHVRDWFVNYGRWKHLFHKGDENCSAATEATSEDDADVKKEEDKIGSGAWRALGQQCPGIWFAPVANNLRVAFRSRLRMAHAGASAGENCRADSEVDAVEHVDLLDIPVGEWFQLTVVLRGSWVEIYVNGKLAETKLLVGSVLENNLGGYIGRGATADASIANFRYVPDALTHDEISALYKREKHTVRNRGATLNS